MKPLSKAGWLTQRSGRQHERWFVCDATKLCYFAQPPASAETVHPDAVLRFLDADDVVCEAVVQEKQFYTFTLQTASGETYAFMARNPEDAQDWVHCLTRNVSVLRLYHAEQAPIASVTDTDSQRARSASASGESRRRTVSSIVRRPSSSRMPAAGGSSSPERPASSLQSTAAVYLEGYLYKTGNGQHAWGRAWKRRWVVLESDPSIGFRVLLYYADRNSPKPRGAILLSDVVLAIQPSGTAEQPLPLPSGGSSSAQQPGMCAFYLKAAHRTYVFAVRARPPST